MQQYWEGQNLGTWLNTVEGLSRLEKSVCFSVGSVCAYTCVWGKGFRKEGKRLQNLSLLWNFVDAAQSILENHFPCGLWQRCQRFWINSLDKGSANWSPMANCSSLPGFCKIQLYWSTATLIHLHYIVYGCLHATTAELSSCNRYHMVHKA